MFVKSILIQYLYCVISIIYTVDIGKIPKKLKKSSLKKGVFLFNHIMIYLNSNK